MLSRYVIFIVFYGLFLNALSAPVFSAASNPQQLNFVAAADIHFNPFAHCTKRPCEVIQKLQQAPASSWPQIFATTNARLSNYKEDTNAILLSSALQSIRQTTAAYQAKFVIILGDFLSHDFRNNYRKFSQDKSKAGYQSFVKKTMTFINAEINKALPNVDVYPLIGNNDSDLDDYFVPLSTGFFKNMAELWAALIKTPKNKAALNTTFIRSGYYAFEAPDQANLRFIMLNSVLFSKKARGNGVGAAAQQQLVWLAQQLQQAKSKDQKVIIAMHIPMGVDVYATLRWRLFNLIQFWDAKYLTLFQDLVQNHANNIVGILAGHLHADWFQIMSFPNSKAEIPAIGTPAISPIFGGNPSYKVFTYSISKGKLEDFTTFYFPLKKNGPWALEYNFQAVFLPNCKYCLMLDGMHRLRPKNVLAERYKHFYDAGGGSQPITQKWFPYYWCFISGIQAMHYQQCIS